MIYVDSPAGTGFSFTGQDAGLATDDDQTTSDLVRPGAAGCASRACAPCAVHPTLHSSVRLGLCGPLCRSPNFGQLA